MLHLICPTIVVKWKARRVRAGLLLPFDSARAFESSVSGSVAVQPQKRQASGALTNTPAEVGTSELVADPGNGPVVDPATTHTPRSYGTHSPCGGQYLPMLYLRRDHFNKEATPSVPWECV